MLVKTEFKGLSMVKYSIASFLIKLALFVLFIYACVDPATIILNDIQDFLNGLKQIELFLILKQIGWMFLYFIIAIVIEVALVFGVIFPIAKSEFNNGW